MKDMNQFSWGYAIKIVVYLMLFGFIASAFLSLMGEDGIEFLTANVAIIPIEGIITGSGDSGSFFDNSLSSQDIVELLEKADKNPSIKAIILEINTPGGSAVASEEIANAAAKINKTTVAWIREVGASGGYWIASASDHIIASKSSITGSIGVIASHLEYHELMEKYGVGYRRLVSGEYKDIGTPFREMTPEEEKIFQKNLDMIRDFFVEEVASNRNMSRKDVEKAANGLFYLGIQAKELGLVDEIGGKEEAVAYIEKKEGIQAQMTEYRKEKSLLEVFGGVASKQSFFIGEGIGNALLSKESFSIKT